MATIECQCKIADSTGKLIDRSVTVTDTNSRIIYATIGGIARTFERIGTNASGNATYREQKRVRRA